MAAPYNSIRSKANRAICAYLVSQNCGTFADVLPANSVKDANYPNTVVRSTLAKPEQRFTGNSRIQIQIRIKGSAAKDPTAKNPEQARVNFETRVATTKDALMMADDNGFDLSYTAQQITIAGNALKTNADATIAANNADMGDFTCLQWMEAGEGDGDETDSEGCDWEEVLLFECVACPCAIS